MPDKISSCPTSYPADYSQELRVYTSKCEKVLGQLSYFHEYAEECLRVYCAWEWQTDIISYIGANETKWETGTWIQWSGAFSTGISTTVVTSQTRWTSTTTRVMAPSDAVKPKAPCCGTCELHAGTVGLYYWPDSKTASNATAAPTGVPLPGKGTYVDEAGFTFVSPSVYIAFTSLGARNRCGDVGNPVYNMTMAFDLTELSSVLPHVKTASCPTVYPNGDPVTYAETSIPPPVPLTLADVAQNCSSIEGYYYDPDHLYNAGAGDPCHPVIAIPDRVKQFQPEWENCGANYYGGFYDPPRALQQAQFIDSTTASEAPTSATPGPSNPTVAPPTSLLVPSIPQESSPVDNPDPSSSGPDLPDPPASSLPGNQPESPASTPSGQPNPVDPPLGSSTILIIPPGPSESQPEQPPANMPPVITLPPNPTNPSDPGQIISVIPTTLPSNPNGPQGSVSSDIAVAIGSTTLTPGQVITIGGTTTTNANGETTVVSGTPVSVDPQGTQLIVDGTSTIPLTTPAQTTTGPPLVVTLGSTTLTANSKTQFVFESTTLSMGGAPVIVSGTTYVMTTNAQGSTELVIGTGGANSTIAPASTTGPSVSEFTGGAAVGLKKTVEVVVTVVLVAVLMG